MMTAQEWKVELEKRFRDWMAEIRHKQLKHCPGRHYIGTICIYCESLHEILMAFCIWLHKERSI